MKKKSSGKKVSANAMTANPKLAADSHRRLTRAKPALISRSRRSDRNDQVKPLYLGGTNVARVGNIAICCMKQESRELLDRIMNEWEVHYRSYKKRFPKIEPGYYGFAYWLTRWSGLIKANDSNETA